jgi:cardiolipin synthase A/B
MRRFEGSVRMHRRPPGWRKLTFPSRGISRLTTRRKPVRQRARDLWDMFRLVVRSFTLWASVALYSFVTGDLLWVGIAGFLSVLALLFPAGIHDFDMRLDDAFSTDSAEFLSTVTGVTGVPAVAGNSLTIYNNGGEFYPAMLAAIAQARHSITMEQYIFNSGNIGRDFADAFSERARAGVTVKLLVDAVGGSGLSNEIVQQMTDAGCQLRWFHPLRWFSLHRINNRTHRKSIIIDGRVAFTGGAGIDDQWCGSASGPKEWRDMQVRLEGPAVASLQNGFATNWLDTTGEVIVGPRFYPALEAIGGLEIQTVLSSPKSGSYTASLLHSLVILCARRSISIANPYFVPGQRTIEMFADAVDRGVTVRIMMSGSHCDTWWARKNSVRLYGKLLAAGVELYEYDATMLHHKTMIVDGIWATIGTSNFDHRSFQHNEESMVCVYDPDVVARLSEIYENDMRCCRRIRMEEWGKRGFLNRSGELVAALLRDQV